MRGSGKRTSRSFCRVLDRRERSRPIGTRLELWTYEWWSKNSRWAVSLVEFYPPRSCTILCELGKSGQPTQVLSALHKVLDERTSLFRKLAAIVAPHCAQSRPPELIDRSVLSGALLVVLWSKRAA